MQTDADMTGEAPEPEGPIADHLRRMGATVSELSARIARLAATLDIDLDNDAELDRVLHQETPQAPVPDRRTTASSGMTPDRRKSHLREELRGLLVLRYSVASSYVERVGVDAARSILVYAQEQLVREGFKDGADGSHLKRLFDTP